MTPQHRPHPQTVPAAATAAPQPQRPAAAGQTTAAASRAAHEARALVDWAVRQRMNGLRGGWNRTPDALLVQLMRPVQVWLEQNPVGWPAGVRMLWARQQTALRLLFPATPAGLKRLARLESLCMSL